MVIATLAWSTLVACTDDATLVPSNDAGRTAVDSGSVDAADPGSLDASADDRKDATSPLSCSGGAALAIAGQYVDSTGAQHWFRRTASAVTYARIPSGPADSGAPPSLWNVTQVCSDLRFFVATSETSTFTRVDWVQDASGVQICAAVENASTAVAALEAPLSIAGSATGCKGSSWTVLTKKDGGV